ncbi:hypothetical protein OsI_21866 [Oryza sativa Indica Group]|uniref:Uncharacterized protein n=2 Tax=Oryza sativa TaxID=4530 RepID=A3B8W0_ORYSJ|nr:hypothetical protein OsI_21866 [Oryza sativa Indica Group]EAZ35999.1 hypothetical protein OsJ_20304 [Oryza sativa Japonica Group]
MAGADNGKRAHSRRHPSDALVSESPTSYKEWLHDSYLFGRVEELAIREEEERQNCEIVQVKGGKIMIAFGACFPQDWLAIPCELQSFPRDKKKGTCHFAKTRAVEGKGKASGKYKGVKTR